jgi:hypothetical protein
MTPPLAEVESERWKVLDGLPRQLDETVASLLVSEDGKTPEFTVERDDDGRAIRMADGVAKVDVLVGDDTRTVELPLTALPTNTQLVGWALVAVFPVSLEIAGVILLMAMFGAVVLARRQIDLSEDEVRVAAGLQPLLEDEDSEFAGGGS